MSREGERSLWRRIVDRSVWGRAPLDPIDARMSALERVGYPWAEGCLVVFGIGGALYGIPALRDVFSEEYARGWSAVIAVVSLWCLVGIAFRGRFWQLELASQLVLVSLLGVYGGALIMAGSLAEPDDFGRSAVGFMPLALIGPLGCRVYDIPREARRRRERGVEPGR